MADIKLIKGGLATDDRGSVGFINEFDFVDIKRFYTVSNHARGQVRAWHGHKKEQKRLTVVKGSFLICVVQIDDWNAPSNNIQVQRYVLTENLPSILYIPGGFAHGLMSLTDDAKLLVFSSATLAESTADDIRFPSRYWDPWHVEER